MAQPFHVVFPALGTAFEVAVGPSATMGGSMAHHKPTHPDALTGVARHCFHRIIGILDELVRDLSRWYPQSTVSQLAITGGQFTVPDYARPMFAAYKTAADITGGEVHPLIGATLRARGFHSDDHTPLAAPPHPTPALTASTSIASPADIPQLTTDQHNQFFATLPTIALAPGQVIDIGAAGKGLAVDLITEALIEELPIDSDDTLLVNGSGDLRVVGGPITIGLENPYNPAEILGVITLTEGSFAASSPARRTHGKWHHLIGEISGNPATLVDGAFVVAPTAMLADLAATCCFFTHPENLTALGVTQWAVAAQEMLYSSPDFPVVEAPRTADQGQHP
ncbi:FAD:protein FMN transferase [Corynebacterium choanae]|uniref:FAD:protein FMN transferase n=1 Tax=Corynebacterium choanae TaxID=1862358 RepID=A0A3G6J8Y6_9CORY|nr:FAD:protein FMN transferase [Corynebacterium choanae]AZA14369.1 ApbE family protein [Corynebacterium choanae]